MTGEAAHSLHPLAAACGVDFAPQGVNAHRFANAAVDGQSAGIGYAEKRVRRPSTSHGGTSQNGAYSGEPEVVAMWVLRRSLHEPVALSAALIGMLNVAVVFGALHLTNEQLGGLNFAVASIFGLVTRLLVSPVHRHRGQQRQPLSPQHPAGSG